MAGNWQAFQYEVQIISKNTSWSDFNCHFNVALDGTRYRKGGRVGTPLRFCKANDQDNWNYQIKAQQFDKVFTRSLY